MRTYSKRERLKIATGGDGDNAVSSEVDGVPRRVQNVEIEDRPIKKLRSAGVRCVSQPFFTH